MYGIIIVINFNIGDFSVVERSLQKQEIDDALVRMVTEDMQPFTIVDDAGFQRYTEALNPRYVIPSAKTLKKMVEANNDVHKQQLQQAIQDVIAVTLTTDLWTSRNTEAYITVTCHFVNKDYKLNSKVLTTSQMNGPHTADNIATSLKQIIEEWNLQNKVMAIVTDNAANMKAAIQILKLRHLPCYAHTLNLVVTQALIK